MTKFGWVYLRVTTLSFLCSEAERKLKAEITLNYGRTEKITFLHTLVSDCEVGTGSDNYSQPGDSRISRQSTESLWAALPGYYLILAAAQKVNTMSYWKSWWNPFKFLFKMFSLYQRAELTLAGGTNTFFNFWGGPGWTRTPWPMGEGVELQVVLNSCCLALRTQPALFSIPLSALGGRSQVPCP